RPFTQSSMPDLLRLQTSPSLLIAGSQGGSQPTVNCPLAVVVSWQRSFGSTQSCLRGSQGALTVAPSTSGAPASSMGSTTGFSSPVVASMAAAGLEVVLDEHAVAKIHAAVATPAATVVKTKSCFRS